jgi:hypothetical protein
MSAAMNSLTMDAVGIGVAAGSPLSADQVAARARRAS